MTSPTEAEERAQADVKVGARIGKHRRTIAERHGAWSRKEPWNASERPRRTDVGILSGTDYTLRDVTEAVLDLEKLGLVERLGLRGGQVVWGVTAFSRSLTPEQVKGLINHAARLRTRAVRGRLES